MAKRLKARAAATIADRLQAEQVTGDVCRLQNEINNLKLDMDGRLQQIRAEYEGELDGRQKQLDSQVLALEAWAKENPDEFPAGRKSIEFVHGIVGFRTGTPKVKTGKRYSTLAALAKAMLGVPWAKKYVKTAEPSLNKEALIADRGTLTAAQLNLFGIQITQDETFYVEPKAETLEQGAKVA